jgi:MFS family permease
MESLLVVFVDRALHQPPATYGLVVTAGAAGALAGTVATPMLSRSRQAALRAFSVSLLAAGGTFAVFGLLAAGLFAGMALFAAFSAAYSISNTLDEYLEQVLTPDHLRGRMIATIGAIGTAGYLIGIALGGPLTEVVDVRLVSIGTGIVIALAGVLGLAWMREPAPPEPAAGPGEPVTVPREAVGP